MESSDFLTANDSEIVDAICRRCHLPCTLCDPEGHRRQLYELYEADRSTVFCARQMFSHPISRDHYGNHSLIAEFRQASHPVSAVGEDALPVAPSDSVGTSFKLDFQRVLEEQYGDADTSPTPVVPSIPDETTLEDNRRSASVSTDV